jgi:hypothetical protein
MARKHRRGDTIHDQTVLAVASDINMAILDGRPYRAKVICATEGCEYPGYLDIAVSGGAALFEQHIPKPRMRPDIIVRARDEVITIVEVVDTSPPSIEKRMKLVRFGVPTLLLDVLEPAVSANGFTASDWVNVDVLCYVCDLLNSALEPSSEAIERAKNWTVKPEPETDSPGKRKQEAQDVAPVTPEPRFPHEPPPFDGWKLLSNSSPLVLGNAQIARLDRLLILTSAEYRNKKSIWMMRTNPKYARQQLLLALLFPNVQSGQRAMVGLLLQRS